MGVARDDLDVLIDAVLEGAVVDPARVHLAKAEFRPLRDEAQCVVRVFFVDLLLVLQADVRGSAVDDHGCLPEGLVVLTGRLDPDFAKAAPRRLIARQARAAPHQVDDLGAVGQQGGSFVEGDLVESEQILFIGKQSDQGLADRSGADNVYDLLQGHEDLRSDAAGCIATAVETYHPRPVGSMKENPPTVPRNTLSAAGGFLDRLGAIP